MQGIIKLGECKEIDFIGGQITKRIEADIEKGDMICGEIITIPPKAIYAGGIVHENLYGLKYKSEIDESKLTREGDVVIKLSTPYDAAYITKDDEGMLITSFCVIIRVKNQSKINPRFLTAFINSQVYNEQIKKMLSGAGVPMLTMGKLKEVCIGSFSMEEQEEIAVYYENICRKELIMKRIIELEKEKIDTVFGGRNNG